MPNNVTGMGTTWNLPNYVGELFAACPTKTPLLSLIGGLTGGLKTGNDEFSTGVLYDFPEPGQPKISESASATALAAGEIARNQLTNVTQIFQEVIELTYAKLANKDKLSGINTAGASNSVGNELDFQIARKLEKIARDVEYTFLNGVYHKATSSAEANQTRGLITLCGEGGSSMDAAGAELTQALLNKLWRSMADKGATFDNVVLLCNSYQKQAISAIYADKAPLSRTEAGVNITDILTDFGKVGVVYDPFMPVGAVLAADIKHIAPVLQEVPGKGVLFLEDLAHTGASERKQIYGQIGLAHGPAFLHGAITGLASGAEEPAAEEPATEEPATEEPAAEEPAAEE